MEKRKVGNTLVTKGIHLSQMDRKPFYGADILMASVLDSESTKDSSRQLVRAAEAQKITDCRTVLAMYHDKELQAKYGASLSTMEHELAVFEQNREVAMSTLNNQDSDDPSVVVLALDLTARGRRASSNYDRQCSHTDKLCDGGHGESASLHVHLLLHPLNLDCSQVLSGRWLCHLAAS